MFHIVSSKIGCKDRTTESTAVMFCCIVVIIIIMAIAHSPSPLLQPHQPLRMLQLLPTCGALIHSAIYRSSQLHAKSNLLPSSSSPSRRLGGRRIGLFAFSGWLSHQRTVDWRAARATRASGRTLGSRRSATLWARLATAAEPKRWIQGQVAVWPTSWSNLATKNSFFECRLASTRGGWALFIHSVALLALHCFSCSLLR